MSALEEAALAWWHHWRESIFHPMSPEMMRYYNNPATRALVTACADKAAEPDADGRTVPAEGSDMGAAIEAATKALGRASIGIQETADCVLAEAAVRAAAPLLRQAVAEEIAAALEAKAAPKVNPRYQETHYLLPEQAAAIAREIGAKP